MDLLVSRTNEDAVPVAHYDGGNENPRFDCLRIEKRDWQMN